jgi:hypothetical protein
VHAAAVDQRLEDVVLDLLVDHEVRHKYHRRQQGREKLDDDNYQGSQGRPDQRDQVEDASVSAYGTPRSTRAM